MKPLVSTIQCLNVQWPTCAEVAQGDSCKKGFDIVFSKNYEQKDNVFSKPEDKGNLWYRLGETVLQ